eukprot:CAMPEP_0197843748 /NCGR_PEP_ID=MMETSP1438-20131217/681_1 /TAXON_ID=1461541 /ORGANISM="Pterosperma sp., Strain CCMP1384" /LENGTH=129 /DNA_ID=CAMNT_0043454107 /DNA_START=84 /DNA_END=474 /DNA_ORIENTATION=-
MRCDISSNITTTRVNGGDDNIDDDEDGDSSDDDSVDVMSPSGRAGPGGQFRLDVVMGTRQNANLRKNTGMMALVVMMVIGRFSSHDSTAPQNRVIRFAMFASHPGLCIGIGNYVPSSNTNSCSSGAASV